MEKRFILFICIAVAAIACNALVMRFFQKPVPQPVAGAAQKAGDKAGKAEQPGDKPAGNGAGNKAPENGAPEKGADGQPAGENGERPANAGQPGAKQPKKAMSKLPAQWLTIGSANKNSPYRMLVLLSSVGAAVEQVELNGGFEDLDPLNKSGYLGPMAETDGPTGKGALVQVVGGGTPAAAAGLKPKDLIHAVGGKDLVDAKSFRDELAKFKPGDKVAVTVNRGGKRLQLTAVLARRPLKVVSREKNHLGKFDPASLLLALHKGGEEVDDAMRTGAWRVTRSTQTMAEFAWDLPDRGLQVIKRYELAKDPQDKAKSPLPGYHLDFTIEIHNLGGKEQTVTYQLDGPTGLPTEGWWYANKIGRSWGGVGVRDVAMLFEGENDPDLISCYKIADDEDVKTRRDHPLVYVAVDAQYFAASLLPQFRKPGEAAPWFSNVQTLKVGPVPADKARKKLTNTSFRLTSNAYPLPAREGKLVHKYQFFVGPKKPATLEPYGLGELVYYGWFSPVSTFLLHVLHFFHGIVRNYGISIIMLTVLVRSCMFPISRKQALGAQKMQELQPELKKLNEKFKSNPEQRTRATQELFRKHNYNPLAGCLPLFLQLPIFMGLYRALMIDVELRQAPLVPGLDWCSNLAAPDMLFYWEKVVPFAFITSETGWLGPFFNFLPVITVALFLWQQKMFMPPPADEQTAMQQKMMQYMMIFMAVMFFKVASGLCIYFIASSLWGIAERKLLPKAAGAKPAPAQASPALGRDGMNGNGAAARRKKQGKR